MKKNFTIVVLAFFATFVYCQKPVILNFDTHSIKNESNNEMKICKYANPGESGENILWDFSNLEIVQDFTGYVKSAYHTSNSDVFPLANTELEEFNNRFYFKVDEDRIDQYGYATKDNNVVVHFEKPFLKMVFPFTYGNSKTGNFNGTITSGSSTGLISGSYEVTADAYGKLMLPGNYVAENTLRVKTVKDYTQNINGSQQSIKITTYRWYTGSFRYPLLVLTEIESGNSSKSYQAAFNNRVSIALDLDDDNLSTGNFFTVVPNPVKKEFEIHFTLSEFSKVTFDVYDLSGKKINTLHSGDLNAGTYTKEINTAEAGLVKGNYLIKATIDNSYYTQEIIVIE